MKLISCNGLGGFMDLGFVETGFELRHRTGTLKFGNPSAEANRHLLGDGWDAQFSDDPFSWRTEKAEVVAGLPPCSGWSCWSGACNRGADAKAHEHTYALMHYAARVKPQAVVFESVQQAITQGREVMLQYRSILEDESGLKYDLHHVKMNNLMIGGYSYRPRYFFVAVREGMHFSTQTEWPLVLPTIMDVIGDLENMPHTWAPQPYVTQHSPWVDELISLSGEVDGHVGRENIHTQRIKDIFAALPDGNDGWDWGMDLASALKRVYLAHGKLPESWASKQDKIVANEFFIGYSQPYRWRGDTWANVLTGGALDLVVHPTQPRTITHREAARIQGLPDDWKTEPTRHYSPLQSVWGKAVSHNAGRWIAEQVKNSLTLEFPVGDTGELVGDREWVHATDKGFSRQAVRKRYYPDAGAGVTRIWHNEKTPVQV